MLLGYKDTNQTMCRSPVDRAFRHHRIGYGLESLLDYPKCCSTMGGWVSVGVHDLQCASSAKHERYNHHHPQD